MVVLETEQRKPADSSRRPVSRTRPDYAAPLNCRPTAAYRSLNWTPAARRPSRRGYEADQRDQAVVARVQRAGGENRAPAHVEPSQGECDRDACPEVKERHAPGKPYVRAGCVHDMHEGEEERGSEDRRIAAHGSRPGVGGEPAEEE